MLETILNIVFPRRCVGCGAIGKYFCFVCKKTVQLLPQRCPECGRAAIEGMTHPRCVKRDSLTGLTSVFRYEGIVKKAVKLLKYRFVSDSARFLIDLIPQIVFEPMLRLTTDWWLYPMPLHQDRFNWRGFNQAEKLGLVLGKHIHVPLVDKLLVRMEKRTPQADISQREDRVRNARGLFKLNARKLPQNVILFDDIWTTGATMKEATKVLKRGAVKRVWGMTLAR